LLFENFSFDIGCLSWFLTPFCQFGNWAGQPTQKVLSHHPKVRITCVSPERDSTLPPLEESRLAIAYSMLNNNQLYIDSQRTRNLTSSSTLSNNITGNHFFDFFYVSLHGFDCSIFVSFLESRIYILVLSVATLC